MSPVDFLTLEDLLEIAEGVLGEFSVRDIGLLSSAAARPQATAFGEDAYPFMALKAAALMHSLARNHALIDGNKRLAWAATRIFLLLNSMDLVIDLDGAEALVVSVATGDLDVAALADQLGPHLV